MEYLKKHIFDMFLIIFIIVLVIVGIVCCYMGSIFRWCCNDRPERQIQEIEMDRIEMEESIDNDNQ